MLVALFLNPFFWPLHEPPMKTTLLGLLMSITCVVCMKDNK